MAVVQLVSGENNAEYRHSKYEENDKETQRRAVQINSKLAAKKKLQPIRKINRPSRYPVFQYRFLCFYACASVCTWICMYISATVRMHDGVPGLSQLVFWSCLFDIWLPFRCLGSEQEGLLKDTKDAPKTATANHPPMVPRTLEAYLTPQSASRLQ